MTSITKSVRFKYQDEVDKIVSKKAKSLFRPRVFWSEVRPAFINTVFVLTPKDIYVVHDVVFNNNTYKSENVTLKGIETEQLFSIDIEVVRKQEEAGMLTEYFYAENQEVNSLITNYLSCITK